ncbi:hypothetical protein F7642_12840 [Tenacibaculum finnmarkense genomovar ulcerans]|uniref:hypothetical protein n=1 Tax=Tenacibaculum finnmarkense TaxID=2781243 RepID=UPI00187B779C|nr:hypothetical protein [Tenacibaculum finnmarkense]MBE7635206.1 hypothetical protein [Tenacibaculum finnmarkense genomovar ulcerans]MCD8431153.1 hypothetical protein [Tenacibaculum finnmarkense genomovar ulcerans]MCG8808878.1 hypothetical protein [Tenacibaculum finnmarkense]MCG8819176.1 hypothetical protein [Tenacibaculum finnmarkense]
MKLKLLIFIILLSNTIYSQSTKDSLFQKDINVLVEEMEFMYGYDQTMREYTIFKTFDKSETDRIENLADSLRVEEMKNRKFESDSIRKLIWKKYINPMDAEHTERMIEITKKYGFPSVERIKKYYNKEFVDPEFSPLIIFIHSPKKYWEELKELMLVEYQNGIINQCQYGYALWQFTGRKSFKPMLENGFEMVKENGKTRLKSTCE